MLLLSRFACLLCLRCTVHIATCRTSVLSKFVAVQWQRVFYGRRGDFGLCRCLQSVIYCCQSGVA